jgi:hypothetical protein
MILLVAVVFSVFYSGRVAAGNNLTFAWNPSAGKVAGYVLYYGLASRDYNFSQSAGTNTTATVVGLTAGQTYYFAVAAYNLDGELSVDSNEITDTIPLPTNAAALQITAQPASQAVLIGSIAVLSVSVTSATPVHYQWSFGGVPVAGATNSVLVLPRIAEGNGGHYTVVASNAAGSVTSQVAAITVIDSAIPPGSGLKTISPGVYNGLFFQTNSTGCALVAPATTGFLSNCTIGQNGVYSSRLVLQGQSFTFSGIIGANGEINTIVNRSFDGLSNLSVTLYADNALSKGQLTGIVSNMSSTAPWVSLVSGIQATNLFSPAELLTFFSPSASGVIKSNLTCALLVSATGVASLTGLLGDGSLISQTVDIGDNGTFPIYQSLYNNTGLLVGWVTLVQGSPMGNLKWICPASSGFTNIVSFGQGAGLSADYFVP